MSELAIPERHEDLTAGWLDSALRSSGAISTQRVVDISVEPLGAEYGRSSSLAVIRPSYSTVGEGPVALFTKFVSQIEGNRKFVEQFDLFRYEIDVYRSLGGKLPIRMPRFVFGDFEDSSDVAVLMMELVEGKRFIELPYEVRKSGLTPETQQVALAPLAEMHAQWWGSDNLDDLNWLRSWTVTNGTYLMESTPTVSTNDLREAIRPFLTEEQIAIFDAARLHLDRIDSHLGFLPETLCHGDYHAQNMLWDALPEASSVVVVDWQIVNRGPAARDLVYFLGTTSGSHRTAEDISSQIHFYYSQLPADLQASYSFKGLWDSLAPANLDHVVRFQVLLSALDFAVPDAAELIGRIFANILNFSLAVGADDWLNS